MILVTGAAGKTGLAVIRALAGQDWRVRALIHRPEQIERAIAAGASEAKVANLRDMGAVERAMQGIRAVYHICPNVSPHEIEIGEAAIAAAQAASVERFVYHSVLHPQIEAMPHHWDKMRVEALLFESGLDYTILQPAAYMQNVLANWDTIAEEGVYAVPYATTARLSMVDLDDVAEAATIVLAGAGHLNATYELSGPEALTQAEVAGIVGHCIGRDVLARSISIDAWTQQARATGLGDYQIETLVKMFRYYDQYGLQGNSRVLAGLLGHEPTRFEQFIRHTIKQTRGSR